MKRAASAKNESGFTVVECLIALFVAAVFILSFALLSSAISSASASVRNRADASDLAYGYLRKYAYQGSTPATFFTCGPGNDRAVFPSANGTSIDSGTVTATTLPKNVTYNVVALAVYGCSGANQGKPIKITASVTYGANIGGNNGTTVSHATYVGY